METIKISSEQELKANASLILRRINRAERGGLLFLLNPTIALGEAGFALSPAMMSHIRKGLRLGADDKKKIKKLEMEINRVAKRPINPLSNDAVSGLLFSQLSLRRPTAAVLRKVAAVAPKTVSSMYEPAGGTSVVSDPPVASADPASIRRMGTTELRHELKRRNLPVSGTKPQILARLKAADHQTATGSAPAMGTELLKEMRKRHPVIPKILEVRALYENGWRFVNMERYMEVKKGKSVGLIQSVRFRAKPQRSKQKQPTPGFPSTCIGKKLRTAAFVSGIPERLRMRNDLKEIQSRRKGV